MMHQNNFSRSNQKIGIAICLLTVFAITTFLSGLGLILCGVFIVKPTLWAKDFQNATCTVIMHESRGEISCGCGEDCYSIYPCVVVVVQFTRETKNGSISNVTAMIYKNELEGHYEGECSVTPSCSRSSFENSEEVYKIVREIFTENSTINCLYNPENTENVILERIFTSSMAKLSMVLPAIFFVIGILAIGSILMRIMNLKKQQGQNYPAGLGNKVVGGYPVAPVTPGYPLAPPGYPSAPPFNQAGYNSQSIPPPPPGMASYDGAPQGFPPQDMTMQGMPPPPPYGTNQSLFSSGFYPK